ncbi:MAG: hypothetical protein WA840_19760 [Caulobacteraceae bacterium]
MSNTPLINLTNRTRWLYNATTALQAALAALAPINSPTFTGSANAPTPAQGDASTLVATTAFVNSASQGLVTIPCDGNANVALTSAQAATPILILTGVLTGAINLIFPSGSGRWLVSNRTTGSFTITCKTAAGSGQVVTQGRTRLIYGDATAVFPVDDLANAVLSGNSLADTPPAGDDSQRVATTAFVQAVGALLAPLLSPSLQGTPTAPTPATADSSARLATTAFVRAFQASLPAAGDMFRANNLGDVASPSAALANLDGLSTAAAASTYAPLLSAILQGAPQAPTPVAGDNTQRLSTTAFVQAAVTGLLSVAAAAATYAPILNPALQGSPQAPTPANNDNSTRIATTAFVKGLVAVLAPLASPVFSGAPMAPTPGVGDNSGRLATTAFCAGLTNGLAPIVSPAFQGAPTAPSPGADDNSGHVANTAWVVQVLGAYLTSGVAAATYAPIQSPVLQGTPQAPTAPAGDNSARIANTNWVQSLFNDGSILGSPGMCRLPGGWILQTGFQAGPFSEQAVDVHMPVNFPNVCVSAFGATSNSNGNINIATRIDTANLSQGQVIFFVNRDSSGSPNIEGFYWFALGF